MCWFVLIGRFVFGIMAGLLGLGLALDRLARTKIKVFGSRKREARSSGDHWTRVVADAFGSGMLAGLACVLLVGALHWWNLYVAIGVPVLLFALQILALIAIWYSKTPFAKRRRFVPRLKRKDAYEREEAAKALRGAVRPKHKRIVRFLVKTLVQDPSGVVRLRLAEVLSDCGVVGLQALAEALRHREPAVRARGARALGHFGASAIGLWVHGIKDPDVSVRYSACLALFDTDRSWKPALITALEGDAVAIKNLAELLGREQMREAGAYALCFCGTAGIRHVLDLIEGSDGYTQGSLVSGLKWVHITQLIEALKQKGRMEQERLSRMIGRYSGISRSSFSAEQTDTCDEHARTIARHIQLGLLEAERDKAREHAEAIVGFLKRLRDERTF